MNPDRWVLQANGYFDFYNIPEDDRVPIASFYFDDAAADWYDWMYRNCQLAGWRALTDSLLLRFRAPDLDIDDKTSVLKLKPLAVDDKASVSEDLNPKLLTVDDKASVSKDIKPKLPVVDDMTSESKDVKPKLLVVNDRTSGSNDVKPKLLSVDHKIPDVKGVKPRLSSVDDKASDSKDVKLILPAVDDKSSDLTEVKLKGPAAPAAPDKAKHCSNKKLKGLSLNNLSLGPNKKLLVLSFAVVHFKGRHKVRGLHPNVTYGYFLVFKRPYCTEFLKFCFERFDDALGSSAMERNIGGVLSTNRGGKKKKFVSEHNIRVILSTITDGEEENFVFVWCQSGCTSYGHYCLGNRQKPVFVKHLKHIWEYIYIRGKYSASNTLLIDDDPDTALLNPPNAGIFPQPYKKHDPLDMFLSPNGGSLTWVAWLATLGPVFTDNRSSVFNFTYQGKSITWKGNATHTAQPIQLNAMCSLHRTKAFANYFRLDLVPTPPISQLFQWKRLPATAGTWEEKNKLEQVYLNLNLEDKVALKGGSDVMNQTQTQNLTMATNGSQSPKRSPRPKMFSRRLQGIG